MIAVIQKVHFCRVLPLPSPRWWRVVCESWSFDTRQKWADEQHWQAGFESRFVPDLPSSLSPLSSAFGLLTLCQVVSDGRQRQINGRLTHVSHSRSVAADWGMTGRLPEPLTRPFWQLPSTLPKSHYLFSYIEILENESKIREYSIVTSEAVVKHVIIYLWLF